MRLDSSSLLHTHCLVRDLPRSFELGLKQSPLIVPIDSQLAKRQHDTYVQILNSHVPNVIQVEVDENHPDCCFIEDTAIVIGNTAVISLMGSMERRGEEVKVKEAIQKLGIKNIFNIHPPGILDGGDVLFTGKDLFIGISKRTNRAAIDQLEEIFKDEVPVYGIPVVEGLHLKSIVSSFDPNTLIVGACHSGAYVAEEIKKNATLKDRYSIVFVPDPVASNVLRLGSTLLIQEGYPMSEAVLTDLCKKHQVQVTRLNMSELIKADGALTCCSILFSIH